MYTMLATIISPHVTSLNPRYWAYVKRFSASVAKKVVASNTPIVSMSWAMA